MKAPSVRSLIRDSDSGFETRDMVVNNERYLRAEVHDTGLVISSNDLNRRSHREWLNERGYTLRKTVKPI